MARKNKKPIIRENVPQNRYREPEIIYAKVPGGNPVARPASNIQLTPIVQPVAFVPYSTSRQPLLVMEDEYEYDE